MSSHTFSRLGFSLFAYGVTKLGFFPSVLDFLHLGSALLIRSFIHLGPSMPLFNVAKVEFSSLLFDVAHLGLTALSRSFAWLGSFPFVYGITKLALSLSVLDFVHMDFTSSLRSFARLWLFLVGLWSHTPRLLAVCFGSLALRLFPVCTIFLLHWAFLVACNTYAHRSVLASA